MKSFLQKHGAAILTVLGSFGVIGTMIVTARCTPKALDILADCKEEGADLKETITRTVPAYIPAAGTAAATILCIAGAAAVNKRQQTVLLGSYAWLDRAFHKYRKQVDELYGEGADKTVMKQITAEEPPQKAMPSNDKCLWYDEFSERYFESTPLEVTEAELHLNRNFVLREFCTVNEFYDFLGIEPIEHGDDCGWSMEAGFDKYGYGWIDFDHELTTMEDGLECMMIRMPFPPAEDYLEN